MKTATDFKTVSTLKNSPCFNPYSYNGKKVNSIIFFKDGEAITSVKWFGSNNNYPTMLINDEIKRKNIADLTNKKPFYVTIQTGYDKGEILVYIPAEMVDLKDLGESIYFDNENETQYQQNYSVSIDCSHDELELKEGLTSEDYNPYHYVTKPIEKRLIEFHKYTRLVKKDKLLKDEQLKQDIKQLCEVDIYITDLQRILSHYNITKK